MLSKLCVVPGIVVYDVHVKQVSGSSLIYFLPIKSEQIYGFFIGLKRKLLNLCKKTLGVLKI